MSLRIGRRRRPSGITPCLIGADGVVRDASPRVQDWSGPALDPAFLTALEDELLADPAALPPFTAPAGDVDVPFSGGRSLVCIGQNFTAHAAEAAIDPPAEPTAYLKPLYTVVPSALPVPIPAGCRTVTWEGELAVVIGGSAHQLPTPDDAADLIAGYTTANDLGDCDWLLRRGGQWVKGKAFPRFTPIGDWLLVGRGCRPGPDASITTRVNGRPVQQARLDEMRWGPEHLVWYVSQFLCLQAGDIVSCGTPGGTALASGNYLLPGDQVEVSIDTVGRQLTRIVGGPDPAPLAAPLATAPPQGQDPHRATTHEPGAVHPAGRQPPRQ